MSPMTQFPLPGSAKDTEAGTVLTPRFDGDGLVVCVTQDNASGEIMMVAYMNAEALTATLQTGVMHYWSRSRGELWRKGDTSGAVQYVQELRVDCDQDAILARVICEAANKTCHTGRTSCFYRSIVSDDASGSAVLKFDQE